jgi:hypothetical protein
MPRLLDRLDRAIDRFDDLTGAARGRPYVPLGAKLAAYGLLLACIIIGLAAAP